MLLQGQFRDRNDTLYTVKILTNNDDSVTRTIGEDGLYFTDDPVVITGQSNDSFDNLLLKTCEINLVSEDYVGDELWAANSHSIVVNIFNETECVFAGYVEPNAYNQPFALAVDGFTLNCVDALSTLEYYNYKNALPNTFDYIRQNSGVVSFKDMLQDIFALFDTLDIDGNHTIRLLYDKSKGLTHGNENTIFNDLGMSESFIIGDEIDDVWTQDKVLEEILKYLNLHIMQIGFDFYVYDWNTLRTRRNQWYNVLTNTSVSLRTPQNISFAPSMYGSDDTNITVDDVYNQIQVKCSLEDEDTVIESPLEDKDLSSLFTGKQLYCREMWADADHDKDKDIDSSDLNGLKKLLLNQYISKDDSEWIKCVDWYMQAIYNNKWKMHLNNGTGDITDIYSTSGDNYINQWNVPKYLRDNRLVPSLFKMGKVERVTNAMDNEPTGKVTMSNYLYIPINGSYELDNNDQEINAVPNAVQLQQHSPMIEYVGGTSGATYSPVDELTTNYLVFQGKLILQPVQYETGVYSEIYADAQNLSDSAFFWKYIDYNVDFDFNEEADGSTKSGYKGRFYTRKFYTMTNPSDEIDETKYLVNAVSLQPPAECKTKQLKYEYSEHNYSQNADLISKLSVLECELIIGNKRLIETDVDQWGNSVFQWVTLGQEPTFVYEGDGQTYTITTFTLGINPKLNDYIIGNEYNIQNTISVAMNLDIEGTAIPIKKSDALSGAVQFRILGPINTMWNRITRRHPTWFRHTQWTDNWKYVLAHCGNIVLKDFSAVIRSDNAGNSFVGEFDDLIYMSDETNKFVNKNDKTTFEFITQLSSEEFISRGVKPNININAVIDMNTGIPISSIYNATTNETAKAEEHYVDAYYREYSVPRIVMESTMHINDINWRNTFSSNTLHRNFFVQKQTDDLASATSKITFKEI